MLNLMSLPAAADGQALIDLGRWQGSGLAALLATAEHLDAPGERIVALSAPFVATPYAADTLIGGPQRPEQLVINLAGFDCFTLLDVVEALRRSATADEFAGHLRKVRYRGGEVDYRQRRHFFSDWVAAADTPLVDVTPLVGAGRVVKATRQLNRKADGSLWLAGIPVVEREIACIPAPAVDAEVIAALRPGDYVGICSDQAGLDVSHVGLLVKSGATFMLRHAASRRGVARVVDEDLLAYLAGKPGLLVYRVKP